ncbi:MAG: hypothetical protein HC904_11795 [Blastochloris sp.]|nr:hypothetical protein [Blastochloris sp.]
MNIRFLNLGFWMLLSLLGTSFQNALPSSPVGLDPMSLLDNKTPLGLGDQINYRVVEDGDDTVKLNVMESGDINVPYFGRVKAIGKTCQQLAMEIKPLLEKNLYHRATVLISIDQTRKVRGKIYLSGALNQIGPMDIPMDETFTLSKAILRAGGFAQGADRSNVRVERKTGEKPEDKQTFTMDMFKVMEGGESNLDMELEPGDLVTAPLMGSLGRVYVVGAVGRAGPIDITSGEKLTVSRAILAAGGFAPFANEGRVKVIRRLGDDPKTPRNSTSMSGPS